MKQILIGVQVLLGVNFKVDLGESIVLVGVFGFGK